MQGIDLMDRATPPRARGTVSLRTKTRDDATVLADLHQSGSLKLLFPKTRQQALTAVMLNTAGGLTGGDRFDTSVDVGAGGWVTMTTQAAERAYRAQPGPKARLHTQLSAGPNAVLHWLPQETLLYDGAALIRQLTIRLSGTARFLAIEPLVFGRQAMGETLTQLQFHDRIDLWRNDALIFADRTTLQDPIDPGLNGIATAAGFGALANLIYAAPDAADQLDWIRQMLPASAGISQPRDGVLFGRLMAPDSFELRRILMPLLERLGGADLPRTWKI